MFHTSHIHVPRNRRPSALRTFITSSSFGPPDTKEPLRRGILLTAVAFVLLLIGSILTWLGFNDVFGGRMSMTGPLLIALSLLLLLLSFRQFLLARKRNNTNNRSSMQLDSVNQESMTAVVVNREDGLHPATIIVDRFNRIGYDEGITVHRHWDEDCAPPSYQEVTRFSSQSDIPSCTTHDDQDELPPTYEETMCSSIYLPAPLISTPMANPTPMQTERSPLVSATLSEMGQSVGDTVTGGGMARDMSQGSLAVLPGGMFAHLARKPSPPMKADTSSLELEVGRRAGQGAVVGTQSVSGIVMPLPQHSLMLPPSQHMSAPASPRQLSAPPSPHPFSAPPSPRQVSSHPHVTPPLQNMSLNGSSLQLSNPTSHMLSLSPSQTFSRPSSPHFSAPSSPRPLSGQHSQTPPPQYTSCPPSPRQFSAPASPHLFSTPRSPCYMSNPPAAMHPMSPQTAGNPSFPPSTAISGQFPGPLQQPLPASSHCARTWVPSPQHAGSSQEGYTCFTYNFVTPLPVETSLSAPPLQGHPVPMSHALRDCTAACPSRSALPHGMGEVGPSCPRVLTHEIRPGFPRADVQAAGASVYNSGTGACVPTPAELHFQRGNGSPQSSCTSRTDIQANI